MLGTSGEVYRCWSFEHTADAADLEDDGAGEHERVMPVRVRVGSLALASTQVIEAQLRLAVVRDEGGVALFADLLQKVDLYVMTMSPAAPARPAPAPVRLQAIALLKPPPPPPPPPP